MDRFNVRSVGRCGYKGESMSYLKFEEVPNFGHKTKKWDVENAQNEAKLGIVFFLPQWRKYVFQTVAEYPFVVFDAGCLQDIVNFLKEQTEQWRNSL